MLLKKFNRLLALAAVLFMGFGLQATPQAVEAPVPNRTMAPTAGGDKAAIVDRVTRRRTLMRAREAAAARQDAVLKAKGGKVDPNILGTNPAVAIAAKRAAIAGAAAKGGPDRSIQVPGPGFQLAQPDYMFGTASNWHNTKPIRKFVDTLPGLGAANANNLGNFIPVAVPITGVYNDGSDYYEIGVQEYTQKLHSGLNPTKLRGYRDLNPAAESTVNGANSSNYLGPVIIARRDKPVRVKMVNQLPTGVAGDLFLPVDTTMMGAGVGPLGGAELYTQNRAEFHLHGGLNPWISDGTPHQWVTPAGEATSYKKGVSFQNVPDMGAGAPGDGIATYYWTNQQSGRFMFYHDHSFGLTRLNVYAGEAAGYLIVDPVDDKLINAGVLPNQGGGVYNYGIPLVIQDKTFVDTTTLGTVGVAGGTDPTWSVAKYGGDGSLWYPHVYMVNQNPADISGANGRGRWDYGAWFWPPVPLAINNNGVGLQHGAEPVVGDPNGTEIPGTPNPSLVPEAFMDTPVVNGAPYPKFTVQPKSYRFRILNAANDRFWNLSFFKADATGTEVTMVPSAPNALWPATWPADGRAGGVPDPATAGPSFIQIGNESGFLPTPVVIAPQPVGYNYNRRDIVVLNIQDKGLFLGPAQRADVIVDFSAYAGQKLILYNDSPAPVPAFDTRFDYYTGSPDQTASGGSAPTLPGFGPNTRTIMLFEVAAATPAPAFDMAKLNAAFTSTATSQSAFAESQHPPIVPALAYNSAMNKPLATTASLTAAGMATTPPAFANNVFVRIQDNKIRYPFPSTENGTATQPYLEPKAIQELFELDYGRMNATLGVELPYTNFTTQTTIPLGYADPATENLVDGATQYWKITHNGVDTHPVHFHLFDLQIINRVGWDGAVRPPDDNEYGWKETILMNPLEDVIVAFRPLSPRLPFALPLSHHSPDVTQPAAATTTWTSPVDGNFVTGLNADQNYGWEYVWHCHILGHEENDFMRAMVLNVATTVPSAPTLLTATAAPSRANLAWTDNSTDETGFSIQRRTGAAPFVEIGTTVPNQNHYSDFSLLPGTAYDYQVVAYNQAGNSAPSNIASLAATATVQVSGLVSTFDPATATNMPLAGVTVTFATTGGVPAPFTVLTDATGAYTSPVPNGWSGTVTPTLAGYAFTPVSLTYAALAINRTGQNFVARPVAIISGTVTVPTLPVATPLAGVIITLTNGGGTAVTDATGAYAIAVNSGWTGSASASLPHYSFAPASISFPVAVTANQPNQNFTATAVIVISGTITNTNTALPEPGVTVTFVGPATTTALTDAAGNYTMTLASPWTGTVTPTKANFAFTPVSRAYTSAAVDQIVQNFAAQPIVTISGVVSALPAGVNATMAFSTGQAVTTGVGGTYSLTVNAPYTGTVTPSAAGLIFTPVSRSYAAIMTDQTAQNFAALAVISGTVSTATGPLAGVTMTYTGGITTTAVDGTYSFTVTPGYSGTLTPAKPGYFFTPLSRAFTAVALSQANQDFTAVQAITVYGYVFTNTTPAVPLAGVTVTFNTTAPIAGSAGTVVTDVNGLFTHYVPVGWTGTFTPSLPGYRFNPVSNTLTNQTTSPKGFNFTAIPTVNVSGTITTAGAPLAGVTVNYSGPRGGSVLTAANGTYLFTVDAGWNGTVTPTLRATLFSPASVSFATAPVLVNRTGLNFFTLQTISGTVFNTWPDLSVNPLPGATITLSPAGPGVSPPVLSDADGFFSVTVPTGFTGILTPLKTGIVFTPAAISYATTPVMTNLTITINSK